MQSPPAALAPVGFPQAVTCIQPDSPAPIALVRPCLPEAVESSAADSSESRYSPDVGDEQPNSESDADDDLGPMIVLEGRGLGRLSKYVNGWRQNECVCVCVGERVRESLGERERNGERERVCVCVYVCVSLI